MGLPAAKSWASRVNLPDVTMMASAAVSAVMRPNISRMTGAPTENAFHCLHWTSDVRPDAGERSTVIYTLLGSCRRHGINSFDYLKDLFTRLPAAKNHGDQAIHTRSMGQGQSEGASGRSGCLTNRDQTPVLNCSNVPDVHLTMIQTGCFLTKARSIPPDKEMKQ
jgi:hypothetical protein